MAENSILDKHTGASYFLYRFSACTNARELRNYVERLVGTEQQNFKQGDEAGFFFKKISCLQCGSQVHVLFTVSLQNRLRVYKVVYMLI